MQLGMRIPNPELALFRHKLPMNVYFETVQLARRWAAPDAFQAGIVQAVTSLEELCEAAIARATELAANRDNYGGQKEALFGENAVLNGPHGPAHMLKHSADFH